MAGQRTGRSQFGFKMVLLAVLWCALHLKDLKAYQTLAVPGSGAPNKAELQKMTVPQLRAKLREKGKKVSGRKVELIERLLQQMQPETGGARDEKRNIPKAGKLANNVTDVFIPLDKTVQKLEDLLEEERVVFIRAGVASGKSTLARHLARTQSSKYLQVNPPEGEDVLLFKKWKNELRETLIQESSTSDVANQSLKHIFQKLYENDQVLIFDECHLLFSCPAFCQLLVKQPGYLQDRLKVLMLSAASEAANEQGAIHTTPAEITAKYMWTPPIPNASQLVHQLAAADVYLKEDAIDFFMRLCGGHRSIFMRAMEWVQWMQRENKTRWDVGKVHAEVRQSWASSTWTTDDNSSLLGVLASVRAVRVNGVYKDANKIPKEFVHILCEGPRNDLAPSVRRDLTVHGFLLPSPKVHSIEFEEFQPYDWHTVDAKYRVSGFVLPAGATEAATVDSRCRQASHIMCRSTPPRSTISQLCAGRCTARVDRRRSGLSSLSKRSSQRTALYQCNGTGLEGARLPSRSNGRWTQWQGWPSSWRERQNLCCWGFDGTQKCKKLFWTSGSLWQCFQTVLQSSKLQVPCHNWCAEECRECEETHARIAGWYRSGLACPKPCTYRLSSLCQARRLCFELLHPMRWSCKEFHHPQETAILSGKLCSEVEVHRARLVCFDEDKPTSIPIFLNCLFAQFVGVLLESPWKFAKILITGSFLALHPARCYWNPDQSSLGEATSTGHPSLATLQG